MRIQQDLNKNWRFSLRDLPLPQALPEGEDWIDVTLPHTWNAVDGMVGTAYARGAHWYVTSFTAPSQPLPGGRTYIEVGAASLVGEIWLNGALLRRHVGGFSAFRADATEHLKPGENLLAIRCDNSYSDKVYPQRADFTFYGGLYRYVRLISVAESHFSLDHYGSDGVYIDGLPAGEGAEIRVKALVDGVREGQQVRLVILDGENRLMGEAWSFAGEETRLQLSLPQAELWDGPEHPATYWAQLSLVSCNEVLDELAVEFGIRDFRLDPEQGFFLNGRSHPLRGVCRHQDRLYEGNALSSWEHWEDAQIIADMGANCIRLAHYQQSHDIYEACDALGLVVWAEIPYFATTWDDEAHAAALEEVREMVAQNYNHPSICFWGLSNEILMAGNDNPKLLGCHRELNQAVKELDSRRYTVIAHEYGAGWDHPLHDVSDAEGWNHYFGWYRGTPEDLGKWLDQYHEAWPQRCVSISEYGCDAVIRYHSEEPVKADYSEEYQVLIHEKACEDFAARPFVWGTFVWNMFDFGSYFRKEGGTAGRNNKGLVTMDRKIRKDAYYVYKAWYSKEPFVHIDGRRWFLRPGDKTTLRIHSNQPEVSLYVDGQLFASKTGEHTFIFENVPLSPGGTALTARAGSESDTISLRGGAADNDAFIFTGFKQAQDAKNWFEGVEDITGDLETVPGCFSVEDSAAEVVKHPAAKKVLMDAITGATQRILEEGFVLGGNLEVPLSQFLSTGFLGESLLKGKTELVIRRVHSALSKIRKD